MTHCTRAITVPEESLESAGSQGRWRHSNPKKAMKLNVSKIILPIVCLMFGAACAGKAADAKVDPTGTWKWSFTGQNGQTRETTLKLKLEGEKLTGTISGRNGDTAIENATLKDGNISFQVTREFNGNKFTQKYNGAISGDSIKGKLEFERDGQSQSRDWEARRETAKAKDADSK
jgi:hypothetical protein